MTSAGSIQYIHRVDVNYNRRRRKIKDGIYRPASNDRLKAMDIISDIWERPPESHFHVFVGLPSAVGRRPGDADPAR
jgi:hypothetical protein